VIRGFPYKGLQKGVGSYRFRGFTDVNWGILKIEQLILMWLLNNYRKIKLEEEDIRVENKLCSGIIKSIYDYYLFGIVLYTESHGVLRKYINDRAFWEQLDSISGDKWLVFIIEDGTSEIKERDLRQHIKGKKKVESLGRFNPSENLRLLNWFNLAEGDCSPSDKSGHMGILS
jgi:hypothetical protein